MNLPQIARRITATMERARPLCPDHRDKATGECLLCRLESVKRELDRLKRRSLRLHDLRLVTLEEYLEANDNHLDIIPELKAAIQQLEDVGRLVEPVCTQCGLPGSKCGCEPCGVFP